MDLPALLESLSTPKDGRLYGIMLAFDAGATVEQLYDATAIDPWFLAEIEAIGALGSRIRDAGRLDAGLAARGQEFRLLRPPDRRAAQRFRRRGRGPRVPHRGGRAPGVQDRRHLRRRVRGQDAVPLLVVRARPRRHQRGGAADRTAQGADPRFGSQPIGQASFANGW